MIFDYIAYAIRALLDETDMHFFEEYQSITTAYRNTLDDQLRNNVPSLYDENGGYNILDLVALSQGSDLSTELRCAIDTSIKNKNFDYLLFTLENVSAAMKKYIKSLLKIPCTYKEIGYLNANDVETNIILLPNFKADWQHNNMWKAFEYGINNYLKNIYVIDASDIKGDYEIKNYVVKYNLFKDAYRRKRLRIGLSPITCAAAITSDNIELYEKDNKGVFSVKDINGSDEIDDNLISIIEKARMEKVDILVFPEMLGTQKTIDKFERFTMDMIDDAIDSNPPITVLPSIWGERENKSLVYIGDCNEPVVQKKLYRFPYEDEKNGFFLEDIDLCSENTINVFHIDKIGRVVIAICKDFLLNNHIDFLIRKLRASLILTPSFSTGHYPFKMISYYGFPYDCSIAWINSCAALNLKANKKDECSTIGAFYDRSIFYSGDCTKEFTIDNCNKKCKECLFTVDIVLKENENEKL